LIVPKNNLNELNAYLETGSLIRKYDESKYYCDLVKLIENYRESDILKKGIEMYKEHGGVDNIFIALVAPSMTGKTQLAFTIQKKAPLYFAFSKDQDIYKNFTSLSAAIKKFASEDCETVLADPFVQKIDNSSIVTLSKLLEVPSMKLATLGFLHDIMNDALNKFSGPEDIPLSDWMNHFANLEINPNANIKAISKTEYLTDPTCLQFMRKFYVFLDEFVGDPELIYIRNLCRLIGLTCVVASTNAKVANLIGLSKKSGSRSEDPSLWSIVVPSLPLIPKEVILKNFGLKNSLITLSQHVKPDDLERLNKLGEYLTIQCEKSRPGISKLIDSFLINYSSSLKTEKQVSLDDIFFELIRDISKRISLKKSIFTDSDGIDSNLKLMIGNHFDNVFVPNNMGENASQAIDSHFFYLKNPYIPSKDPFLLYRSLFERLPKPPLYICRDFEMPIRYNTQCYFNVEEEILMLACLFGEISTTTTEMFNHSLEKSTLGNTPNKNALVLSGSLLENQACAAVIDSSHFSSDRISVSLEGVSLRNFISNLFGNLDNVSGPSRMDRCKVYFDKVPELEHFCRSFKVPFLFPTNLKVPKILEELFPVHKSKLRFGEYTRTRSNAVVDASFDLIDQNDAKFVALIECKNRKDPFSTDDLLYNLEKSFQFCNEEKLPKCRVHFSICKNTSNFKKSSKTDWRELSSFTEAKLINVYRLSPMEDGFELLPVKLNQTPHKNPKMVSIILNMKEIDLHFAKLAVSKLKQNQNQQ
jgi:hypothetical protein